MSIIIGTWPLSGDFGHVRLEQIAATLRASLDHGFTRFDTAPNYGNGFIEACLGKELAGLEGVRINTKFGNRPFLNKSFRIPDLKDSFEQSLRRLAIEQVDVLFLHNPRDEIADYNAIFELYDTLKDQGKIERSGISLAKDHSYSRALLQQFDVIQDDANLLSMSALHGVAEIPNCYFMARTPLASGVLGGRITELTAFDRTDQRSTWLKGARLRSIMQRVQEIRSACDEPLPELAYRFLLSHPCVQDVICGVRRPEHVHLLAKCDQAPRLNESTLSRLEKLWQIDFGLSGESALGY